MNDINVLSDWTETVVKRKTDINSEPTTDQKESDQTLFINDFPEMKRRQSIILEVAIVALFTVLSFTLALIFLNHKVAPLTDGGYYQLQVKTLLEEGQFYFESPFLTIIIMAFFSVITRDISQGVILSAGLFIAASVISNYFAAKIIWNKKVATLTLPFSAFSYILLRMSTDLSKNLLALVFVPLAFAYFNDFHTTRSWKSFALSITFTGLVMTTHLMTALALSVCLVGYFVIYHIITTIEEKQIDWKKIAYSASILLASALIMGLTYLISEFAIPVKDTYWNYSSNAIPDGDSSYTPSDDRGFYSFQSFFMHLPVFEKIILAIGSIIVITALATTKSKNERNGIILLLSMILPLIILGISIDVSSWPQRMAFNTASFLILYSGFIFGFIVQGIEETVFWLQEKQSKINLNKIKPKITITIMIVFLLIIPMIFPYIAFGKQIRPIVTPEEIDDLQAMQGQLPTSDCLLYAIHGLEYWVSYFSGYQCRNSNLDENNIEEIYEKINVSSPTSYYVIHEGNPNIPLVKTSTGPIIGDSFDFIGPLNASVHPSPVNVTCYTPSGSSVYQMDFELYDYVSKGLIISGQLIPHSLPGGATEWNITLPPDLSFETYELSIKSNYYIMPGVPAQEKVLSIFYSKTPPFNTVYKGRILGVIESNPSYSGFSFETEIDDTITTQQPNPPSEPQEGGKEEASESANILTFLLLIQFPFLTDYLHYYFVIPLTVAYWTLIIVGSYKIVRLIIAKNNNDEK